MLAHRNHYLAYEHQRIEKVCMPFLFYLVDIVHELQRATIGGADHRRPACRPGLEQEISPSARLTVGTPLAHAEARSQQLHSMQEAACGQIALAAVDVELAGLRCPVCEIKTVLMRLAAHHLHQRW